MNRLLAISAALGCILLATPASACLVFMFPDPETGEMVSENTPRGLTLLQAELRGNADAVLIAQVSAMRLAEPYAVDLTFTAVRPVYDAALSEPIVVVQRRIRSQMCEWPLQLGQFAVLYVRRDGADGWTLTDVFRPEDLQDRPEGYGTLLRRMADGSMPLPDYGDVVDPAELARMARADRSFSPIPFGSRSPPEGLVSVDPAQCEDEGECAWRDDAGVEHYYWEGELAVKTVTVVDVGDRSIAALGIGTARSMDDVVRNVRVFLPEANLTCRQSNDGHDCGATLGKGWFTLFFDAAGRLTEARLDARHFT
ncbi:MAG: hypothetical protein EON95_19280 [Caulobacteraceae bacterium]|nr:MAG: hypothetical protein EON95_19280 [Caulobacteraceae bacterium]